MRKTICVLGGLFRTTKPLSRENCMFPGRIQKEGFCSVHFFATKREETRVCANKKNFFSKVSFFGLPLSLWHYPVVLDERRGRGRFCWTRRKGEGEKFNGFCGQNITYAFIANFQVKYIFLLLVKYFFKSGEYGCSLCRPEKYEYDGASNHEIRCISFVNTVN